MSRISNVVQWAYKEEPLFDYQIAHLDDYSTKALWLEKFRGTGFSSRMSSSKGVVKAVSIPMYTKIFLSHNMHDCQRKIDFANDLYDRMTEIREFRSSLPDKIRENTTEIRFRNGSRLVSLFMPLGEHKADLDLDEFGHYKMPRKVYKAALPITLHGGQVVMASTTVHSGHMFQRVGRHEGGQFTNYKRARIYWWDCALFCRDVQIARFEALGMDTRRRVEKFGTELLKQMFQGMFLEDFQQEFELAEPDDMRAYLPWELIIECTPTGEDGIGTADTVKELASMTRRRPLFLGYDVGRKKDKSELTVFEIRDKRAWERYTLTLERKKFAVQEAAIAEVARLPNLIRGYIDETGMGMDLSERLGDRFPGKIEGVSFTGGDGGSKAVMASNMRANMELGRVIFEPNPNKNFQMHAVKKAVSSGEQLRLVVEKSDEEKGQEDDHHADVFWARALALYAWKERAKRPEPRARLLG